MIPCKIKKGILLSSESYWYLTILPGKSIKNNACKLQFLGNEYLCVNIFSITAGNALLILLFQNKYF